jgi:hypothetical protein
MARTRKYYLKNNYLTLRSKVKVTTVHDTLPCGHAPTYQISLTYLERQKSYGPDKLRWEEAEAEAEEKIWLKQYVSLRSKGRHNYKKRFLNHMVVQYHDFCFPFHIFLPNVELW